MGISLETKRAGGRKLNSAVLFRFLDPVAISQKQNEGTGDSLVAKLQDFWRFLKRWSYGLSILKSHEGRSQEARWAPS